MVYADAISLPECYRMLKVSPGVNWIEVKKSYRALALKFHPDRHPEIEGCESRFKEISRAFKTLESHYKNSKVEEYGCSFSESIKDPIPDEPCTFDLETPSPEQQSFLKSFLRRRFDRELVIDIKTQLVESLRQLEKKAFQLDVKKEIKVDSATVAKGGAVKVCQNKENFKVPLPQGAWNRMKIKIPNKGEASWFTKKRGDLLLDVQVLSSNFKVYAEERDLYYDFPVSVEAVKKRKTHTLMTIQGAIKFILPRNTTNGQVFTLKAKPRTEKSLGTNHVVKIQLHA